MGLSTNFTGFFFTTMLYRHSCRHVFCTHGYLLTAVYPSYLWYSREVLWNMLKKEQKVIFSGLLLGESKIIPAKKQLQMLSETLTYTQFHQIKVASLYIYSESIISLLMAIYFSLPYLIILNIDTYFLWLIVVTILLLGYFRKTSGEFWTFSVHYFGCFY